MSDSRDDALVQFLSQSHKQSLTDVTNLTDSTNLADLTNYRRKACLR